MRYLSVCAGIEAATVAWHPLGWAPVAFSEIEKFPCAVLAHHYPGVVNLGDLTRYREWPDDLAPDLVVGGTPCQSFSVAGLRKGLDDPRGNLALVFLGLVDRYRPRWVVWENVPGVRSSGGGRDLGAFLGALGELGYGWSYRSLDAQYFGLAQRRERVFVVGHLGDWRPPAAVLLEPESLSGHPPPSREAGQAAPTIPSRSSAGGGLGTDFDCDGGLIHCPDVSPAMKARDHKGVSSDGDGDGDGDGLPVIAFGPQNSARQGASVGPISPTLDKSKVPAVGYDRYNDALTGDVSPTIAAANSGRIAGVLTNDPSDKSKTPAVAFAENQRGELRTSEIAAQLTTGGGKPGQGYPAVVASLTTRVGGQGQGWARHDEAAHLLPTTTMAVRRLTPRECERLQGFPDDYTLIPWRGKPAEQCPDGPRYKALGNSMAVPVMRWIGERIAMVEELLEALQDTTNATGDPEDP